MGIKLSSNKDKIVAYIRTQLRNQQQAQLRTLAYVGERCVNEARSYHGRAYKDQTGNLRSSVGYVISVDGRLYHSSSFMQVGDGGEGANKGKDFALEIAKQFPHGVTLIVVAGMHYAKYVAAKGYNVLQSAELLAEQLIPELLRQLSIKT